MNDSGCPDSSVHGPDAATEQAFRLQEQEYWRQRDQLLEHYLGRWVAIVDGEVVAVGDDGGRVAAEAYDRTHSQAMFVALVGEEEPLFRVRSTAAGHFDRSRGHPAPIARVKVINPPGRVGEEVDALIDTGADLTMIRSDVATAAALWQFPGGWGLVGGFAGPGERRCLYRARISLAGEAVPVLLDCRADIAENILGRDVLNEFALYISVRENRVEISLVEEAEK
jgi:hypothetical protein